MEESTRRALNELLDNGRRIREEEIREFFDLPLPLLSLYANNFKEKQLSRQKDCVTYIVDCNVNYTNYCSTSCKFCAFYVPTTSKKGWVLSVDEILEKCRYIEKLGATQVMLQGGHYDKLSIDYFIEMFKGIKKNTSLWIHSLGPSELHFLSKTYNLPVGELIDIFKDAGLDSIAGAGAEILGDPIRRHIAPLKESGDRWMEIMEIVHQKGMRSSVTMLMCVGESIEDRIDHLVRIRNLQDKTGGFNSFIPYVFQPYNNKLVVEKTYSYVDYLKMVAISRLFLDNVKHIQGSWLTTSDELATMSLHMGADDIGSIMLEENVVSSAGAKNRMTLKRLLKIIQDAGKRPAVRDSEYKIIGHKKEIDRQLKMELKSHMFSRPTTK